ncbi:MAG: hypothetical protein FJ387_26220 [Verrucomicrobia bacterium]|nr:hypothetical protein [Verrucomicrobiota bacterium]
MRPQAASEGQRELRLTVERGNDVNLGAFTVDYATADGTAKAGLDYEKRAGRVQFAPGAETATLRIPIHPDDLDEGDEGLLVGDNLRIAWQDDSWCGERTRTGAARDMTFGHDLLVGVGWPGLGVSADGQHWPALNVLLHQLAFGGGPLSQAVVGLASGLPAGCSARVAVGTGLRARYPRRSRSMR